MLSIATLMQLTIPKLVEELILAMHEVDRAVNIIIVFTGSMRLLDITQQREGSMRLISMCILINQTLWYVNHGAGANYTIYNKNVLFLLYVVRVITLRV